MIARVTSLRLSQCKVAGAGPAPEPLGQQARRHSEVLPFSFLQLQSPPDGIDSAQGLRRLPYESVPSFCRANRGFTLVEMMITLAIFMLLAAAVFGVLMGVLQGASELTDNQNHVDQVVALKAYLDKRLGELPARSTLTSYQRGDGEGLVQNGIIYGTVNFATAIDAKVQPNGYYSLRLATYETTAGSNQPQDARQVLQIAASTDDPTLVWTQLMTDVKTLDWKFLDYNTTLWVEIWSSGTKPNLCELSMQLAGDLQPTTMDFWLPKISNVPGATQGGGNR